MSAVAPFLVWMCLKYNIVSNVRFFLTRHWLFLFINISSYFYLIFISSIVNKPSLQPVSCNTLHYHLCIQPRNIGKVFFTSHCALCSPFRESAWFEARGSTSEQIHGQLWPAGVQHCPGQFFPVDRTLSINSVVFGRIVDSHQVVHYHGGMGWV